MKTTVFTIIAAFGSLAFVGCATAGSKLTQVDSRGEFAMAQDVHAQKNSYHVERISGGSGKIATGHARKDAQGVLVAGYVEKLGPGGVTAAWSHVDVIVLDSTGRRLQKVATKFFPSEVPNTQRGIIGRSRYNVRLPTTPPAGSTVQVAFHQKPISQCESEQEL